MRVSEWLVVAYFAYLAGAAAFLPVPRSRRIRVCAVVLFVILGVLVLARNAFGGSMSAVRNWTPVLWLVLGYRLPRTLVTGMNDTFQRKLVSLDQRWFGGETISAFQNLAPSVKELLEFAYLLCYSMVPIGLASRYLAGLHGGEDRYWTGVLIAGFSCYGALPWLATQPPRRLERPAERTDAPVRHFNLRVLEHASVGLNTFPSGHVATALATTLLVAADLPVAGLLLGLVTAGIAVGSVVGRYHYAADAIAGAIVAAFAFLIALFV
jgi:membrane-associated phospholipid phosphatase